MDQDNLNKFVANMRASGQTDEMIADNLLSAGNSELMVLNALGISDLDELKDEVVEKTFAPVIDSAGHIEFNDGSPQPDPPKSDQSDEVNQQPLERGERNREYPRPAPREERSTDENESNDHEDQSTQDSEKEHQPEHTVTRSTVDAASLHGIEMATTPTRSLVSKPPSDDNQSSHETDHENHDASSVHKDPISSKKHRSYNETIDDLTAHKELKTGFDHEIEAGEEPVKPVVDEESDEMAGALSEDVVEIPPNEYEELLEQEELPQEIKVEELDPVTGAETKEIEELAKKAASDVEKSAPSDLKPEDIALVHAQTQVDQIGSRATNILNSVGLKITIILMCVGILIFLAVSLSKQI